MLSTFHHSSVFADCPGLFDTHSVPSKQTEVTSQAWACQNSADLPHKCDSYLRKSTGLAQERHVCHIVIQSFVFIKVGQGGGGMHTTVWPTFELGSLSWALCTRAPKVQHFGIGLIFWRILRTMFLFPYFVTPFKVRTVSTLFYTSSILPVRLIKVNRRSCNWMIDTVNWENRNFLHTWLQRFHRDVISSLIISRPSHRSRLALTWSHQLVQPLHGRRGHTGPGAARQRALWAAVQRVVIVEHEQLSDTFVAHAVLTG